MKQWLDEATVKPTGALNSCDTRSGELYQNYRRWAEARGERVLPQKDFSPKLEAYGYKKAIKKGTPYFRDIALRLESGGGGGEDEPINSLRVISNNKNHPKGVNRMTSTTSTPLKSPGAPKFAGPPIPGGRPT